MHPEVILLKFCARLFSHSASKFSTFHFTNLLRVMIILASYRFLAQAEVTAVSVHSPNLLPNTTTNLVSPLHLQATAEDTETITGFVVYVDDVNVYQNFNPMANAWITLPLGTHTLYVKETFPKRCVIAGVVLVLVGLGLNVVLFVGWLANKNQSALSHFGLASLSQSLIITGGTLASFGVISRFLRARAARVPVTTHRASDGRGTAAMATTASSLSAADQESTRFGTGSADGPSNQVAPVADLAFTPEARAQEDGLGPVGHD